MKLFNLTAAAVAIGVADAQDGFTERELELNQRSVDMGEGRAAKFKVGIDIGVYRPVYRPVRPWIVRLINPKRNLMAILSSKKVKTVGKHVEPKEDGVDFVHFAVCQMVPLVSAAIPDLLAAVQLEWSKLFVIQT